MNQGIIAVDIGGSHITSVMIDSLKTGSFATPFQKNEVNSQDDLNCIIQAWYDNIATTIKKAPKLFSNKVAIAIPGPFDYKKGIGLYEENGKFAALRNAPIRQLLHTSFSSDTILHFENDAACFGIGECHYGSAKPYSKSMAITLGTGIGCTFIENKQVVKLGNHIPKGGEIFHLPFRNATADDYFSTRWFVKAVKEKYQLDIAGVKELTAPNPVYNFAPIFQEFAENLVAFLLPIAQKFGAEAIIFGGNISKAWSYFSPRLLSCFTKYNIAVFPSALNEVAICLGAAQSFHQFTSKAILT